MEVYLGIKEVLREGSYRPGILLPTEVELEKIYHVSRITIRRAISMLEEEGYVKQFEEKVQKFKIFLLDKDYILLHL